MIDPGLVDHVRRRFGIESTRWTPIVGAGDECLVWVLPDRGTVVRVGGAGRDIAGAEWAFTAAERFADTVPEVCAPVRDVDGVAAAPWNGRVVSLWPLAPGRHPVRGDDTVLPLIGDLLARLHRAASGVPTAGAPRPRAREWPAVVADATLDDALDRWAATGPPSGVIHGDVYPRNVLRADDGRLTLIDWDDARVDFFGAELAWTVWEFAQALTSPELDAARARTLIDAYVDAGGDGIDGDVLVALIRRRMRREIADAVERGDADDAYTRRGLAAFRSLEAPW